MLTVSHIQTTTDPKDPTKVVPVLDANGQEIVLWSVEVPREIEAEGGAAIDAYVAAHIPAAAPEPAATVTIAEES